MDGTHLLNVDELDLKIMETIVEHPDSTFKEHAVRLDIDQRTLANRVRRLSGSGALKLTYEIDWGRLGLTASAYVGSTTAVGEKNVSKLLEFIRADPRIVEAYQTVGAHQYLMRVVETDLPTLRDSVLRDLEPLTADLTTTLITRDIKPRNYLHLLRYCREVKYPRSRAPE